MPLKNGKIEIRDKTVLEGDFEKKLKFEIITTFSYKGRVTKSSFIAIVMLFVSVLIHHARMRSAFFGGLRASRS